MNRHQTRFDSYAERYIVYGDMDNADKKKWLSELSVSSVCLLLFY